MRRPDAGLSRRDGGPRGAEFGGGLTAAQAAAAAFAALFTPTVDSWFDADLVTLSAGKVAGFVDYMDPTHSLVQGSVPNQAAAPTASVTFAGATAASFLSASSIRYVSTRAASAWTHLHNPAAPGCTVIEVYASTGAAAIQWLWNTCSGAGAETGIHHYTNMSGAGTVAYGMYNGSGASVFGPSNVGSTVGGNVGTYNVFQLLTPQAPMNAGVFPCAMQIRNQGTPSSQNTPSASTGAPTNTLTLGAAGNQTLFSNIDFRAIYLWKRALSVAEIAIVRAYITATTGIT